ncbi:DUF6387 family protein [Pseudomonas oryzae]|uniref:Uncharacterized protein n=1 Tax=Pseudomonas oryzae TaxID=1392877 RepID=A0A1H1MYC6_9PSED|nr:DUF6387 family protein [Pseudomonas oryzae]SDR91843.1 hypothetical protein SAMN05216221_0651 [Pseudomonas oryzae]
MSNRSKYKQELPEWFSRDNYNLVSGFGILEWRNELLVRAIIAKSLRAPGFEFLMDLDLIRWVPDDVVAKCLDHARGLVTGKFSPVPLSEAPPFGVARFGDLRFQALQDRAAVESGHADQISIDRWGMTRPGIYLDKNFLAAMNSNVSVEYGVGVRFPYLLKVDLGAPDSVLEKAFSDWLLCARKSRKKEPVEVVKSKNTGTSMYDSWRICGVLPYLDLHLWSVEHGASISSGVMAGAVVPHRSSGYRFMMERTVPDVKKLMAGLESIEITCFYEQRVSG